MNEQYRVTRYLNDVKESLLSLNASEREEIIQDLKCKINEQTLKQPHLKADEVIGSLGSPTVLANFILLQKGNIINRVKSKSSLKHLLLFMMGLITLAVLSLGILIWKFTPIIELSSDDQKISILGGAITLNSNHLSQIKLKNNFQKTKKFKGTQEINMASVDSSFVVFQSGHFELSNSETKNIIWDCDINSDENNQDDLPVVLAEIKSFHLDFSQIDGAHCKIQIPRNLKFSIKGSNGSISFNKVQFPVYSELENGEVIFSPDEMINYQYEIHVSRGQTDHFDSSEKNDALKIHLSIENGSIVKN